MVDDKNGHKFSCFLISTAFAIEHNSSQKENLFSYSLNLDRLCDLLYTIEYDRNDRPRSPPLECFSHSWVLDATSVNKPRLRRETFGTTDSISLVKNQPHSRSRETPGCSVTNPRFIREPS